MLYSKRIMMAAMGLASFVSADFQIYVSDIDSTGQGANEFAYVFDGEPDCNDVGNAIPLSIVSDASSGGVRLQLADTDVPVKDYDIQQLEINSKGWGHFTLYENAGYQLTPADGSAIPGSCTRDSGDSFDCPNTAETASGVRIFICTDPNLGGIHS